VAYIVIYNGLVVDIGNMNAAKVIVGAVVKERSIVPISAKEPYATIAESIINPAVKSDMQTPISPVPAE
jgi:hypothetical protein